MLLKSVIVLTALVTPILCQGGCATGWTEVNDRCFRYESHKRSYEDAQEACRSDGAELAWITDYTDTVALLEAMDIDKYFWIGAMRNDNGDLERPNGESYPIDTIGFWGKGQPKDKRDYKCVLVDAKKGKKKGKGKHHHGQGSSPSLEWELKKCKDKKPYLCELKCEAGEIYCGGVGCVSDISECYERPPTVQCDDMHNFAEDGSVFKSTDYNSMLYPADATCVYRLYTDADFILKLEFDVFDMGSDNQDFIEIYVGGLDISSATFFGRFSDRNSLENRIIYSTNNRMVIIMRTDGRQERDGRGFSVTNQIYSRPTSFIDEIITLVIGSGVQFIESPGFSDGRGGELPSIDTRWTFGAPIFSQIIFSLDSSTDIADDSVIEIWEIVGGSSVRLAIFTGLDLNLRSVISTSNDCYVTYTTGPGQHWDSQGFQINFEISTVENCVQNYFETSGVALSPGYGKTYIDDDNDDIRLPYPVNYACRYSLVISSGGNFTYWFDPDFGIEDGDELEIEPASGARLNPSWTLTDLTAEDFLEDERYRERYPAFGFVDLVFTTDSVTYSNENAAGFKVYFSKDCPVPEVSEWTMPSQDAPYQHDNEVEITCMEGYEFQDDDWSGTEATIKCLMDGVWNVTRIPTCQPIFCDRPPTINNGYVAMSDGLLFGQVVMYQCFEGLTLEGNENSSCQANKTWSPPPMCQELTCTLAMDAADNITSRMVRNATGVLINTTMADEIYSYGSVVERLCTDGYYVEGVKSIACTGANEWNDELGSCEKIRCYLTPIIDGLMFTDAAPIHPAFLAPELWGSLLMNLTHFYEHHTLSDMTIRSVLYEEPAYVFCKIGYIINGTFNSSAEASLCQANGTFDVSHSCIDIDECELSPCNHTCVNTPGSYYCMCDDKYELAEDMYSCDLIPGCVANMDTCDHTCMNSSLPEWFTCSCDEPYVLYEELGIEGWYKHGMDTADEQLRINQSCVLPQCPLEDIVASFDNYTIILGHYNDTTHPYHYNDSMDVMCDRGRTTPSGMMMMSFMCRMQDGMLGWYDMYNNSMADNETSRCTKEVSCNGTRITQTDIMFSEPLVQVCGEPYNFNITSVCDLDPVSNEYKLMPDVVCPILDCGVPDIQQTLGSTNLTLDCTTLGCSFEFACDGGSQPLPTGTPTTVVCMENGKWNYSNIYCEGTTCPDPGMVNSAFRYATMDMDPEISFTLSNLKSGGRIYYSCIRPGYELQYDDSKANFTECDGTTWSPPVDEMSCQDVEPPVVVYCPPIVEVFRYSTFNGTPFEEEFYGYPSPKFTDNTGISSVVVDPMKFHSEYVFDDDLNVTFAAKDFTGLSSEECHVMFKVIDVETPVLTCSELVVVLNITNPEVNVTDKMILSMLQIDGALYNPMMIDDMQMIEVEISDLQRTINPARVKDKLNSHALITVTRTYSSGARAMNGDLMYAENRTVSAQCSVAVLPDPDLCMEQFAPNPAGAERVCSELESGDVQCSYTCTEPNALIYQYSTQLSSTATSTCSNSTIGYQPVKDCIVSGYAVAGATHIFRIIENRPAFEMSLSCYEKLVEGYKNWTIHEVCNGSIKDMEFSLNRNGIKTTDLTTLMDFIPSQSVVSGFPIWHAIPFDDMRGAEVLCDLGSAKFQDDGNPFSVNLTFIDECLLNTRFQFSRIDEMEFTCEAEDLTPIEAGQTMIGNVSYPYYSCFKCPAGTYLKTGDSVSSTCEPCPIDQWFPLEGTQTACLSCPTGTTTVEEGQATCSFACPPGFTSDNGIYPCMPCPVGTYSVNGTYCESCPADTMGQSNAQSSNESCRAMCDVGTYSEDGHAPMDGECTPCPPNFMQNMTGSTSCMRCEDDQDTDGLSGATECMSSDTCPTSVSDRCRFNNCYQFNGMHFCSSGCTRSDLYQGQQCQLDTTTCDKKLCDAVGSTSCDDDTDSCVCNTDISGGDLCDNITATCDQSCDNGGECFLTVESYTAGADLVSVCLCGGQWSGETCTEVEDKCNGDPCVAMQFDECVSEDVRARCDCKLGYMGYNCQHDIDGCASSPCYNGGMCNDTVGNDISNDDPYSFQCTCLPGFMGDQCEMRLDECEEDPCGDDSSMCIDDYQSVDTVYCLSDFFSIMVNATIAVETTSFCQSYMIDCENEATCMDDDMYKWECECSDIYDGMFCQHRIDFCMDMPCGVGNCTNTAMEEGYICECPAGYITNMTTCVNINECDYVSTLCNAGECIDTQGSFRCVCDEEHDGMNCETNINECLFMPCMGNATCEDTDTGYMCHCEDDRSGDNCEMEKDMCDDQCQNEGMCFPVYSDYVCQCTQPSYGRHCENLPDMCETEQPCAYGGDCSIVDTFNVTCSDCDDDHFGQYCQLWSTECTVNPCMNDGVCGLAYLEGYHCECPEGFVGDRCEQVILNPCDAGPCPAGASCVRQGLFDYECNCPSGFIGSQCTTPIDADFEIYFNEGDDIQILNPTTSPYWDGLKFTISSWIRPDRVFNDDGDFIDIIHLTVGGEVLLQMNAHGVIYGGVQYNISTNPEVYFTMGVWAFFGVSLHTNNAGDASTITVYANGIVIEYDLPSVPEISDGNLNTIVGPNRDFVGYCGQVYLWAGASFPKSGGSGLNAILNLGVGAVVSGLDFAGEFIHYYWSAGDYSISPFCQVARPSAYCVTDCDDDDNQIGTYLEFERGCPDDILVTTSSRSVVVTWDPPIFLANGVELTPDTPDYTPGSSFGIGRHKIKYEARLRGKRLKCDFKVYVRQGCDGITVGRRCVKPYQETGLTEARARARCRNFGGDLIEVTSQALEDRIIDSIQGSPYEDQQFMVGYYMGADDNPQCISIDDGGDVTTSRCEGATGLICGRAIASTESCVLPDVPDGLSISQISEEGARLLKYSLSCENEGYTLASYAPRTITCYPEGNWDYDYGLLPRCVQVAPDRYRFRFRIRIRFVIRVSNPCVIGRNSITYGILNNIWNVLQTLNTRWNNGFRLGSRRLSYCCSDPDRCDTSASCGRGGYSMRCGCSARGAGRKKRQIADGNDNEIELDIGDLPDTITGENGETLTPQEVITAAVASGEFADEVGNELDVIADPPLDGFAADTELDCNEGYEAAETECVPCSPGTYWTNDTATCELCPLDTYQEGVNATECMDCPADTTTYFIGATNESQCQPIAQPGQFYNGVEIQNCSIGYFQPNTSAPSCLACEPGTTTVQEGSESEDDCVDVCPAGEQFINDQCTDCELGYHRDPLIHLVCQQCPSGFITDGLGSESANNCTIVDCPVGTYRDENSNTCMNCTRGEYQNEIRQTMCEPCGDNYTTADEGSSQQLQCQFICPDGYGKVDGVDECEMCAEGTYRMKDIDAVSTQTCTECPEYYTTPTTGAVNDADCTILRCPAGMQSNDAQDNCEECPIATYSEGLTEANVKCDMCPAEHTTLTNGSANATDCFLSCPDAGEESYDGSCRPCMIGYYALDGDQTCNECPENFTSPAEGSQSADNCTIILCDAGYKRDPLTDPETCVACEIGFYQDMDNTNLTECMACPNTTAGDTQTTADIGGDSIDSCKITCPIGQEDRNNTCEMCFIGYYKENDGAAACTQCPQTPHVLTTNSTGSTNATDCDIALCDAGYYSSGIICENCAIGTYQEEDGFSGDMCMPCQPFNTFNTTTDDAASTMASDCKPVCPEGHRTDLVAGCIICPADTYLDGDSCEACPATFSTNDEEGSTSVAACSYKICVPGERTDPSNSSACMECPQNTYNDVAGGDCKNCSAGSITLDTGMRSSGDCIADCPNGQEYSATQVRCVNCPLGAYRNTIDADDDYRCKQCERGTTTAGTGSSNCPVEVCDAGNFAELGTDGVYTCKPCPVGTYQPKRGEVDCLGCGDSETTNSSGKTREDDCMPPQTCTSSTSPCPDTKHTCTDSVSGPVCTCPSAYLADGDSCIHNCERTDIGTYCENDGICNSNVDEVSLLCTCTAGFMGDRCDTFSTQRNDTPRTTLIVVGVVAGVVLAALLITALVVFAKKGACMPAHTKQMMYAETPTPVGYPGGMVPAHAYYPSMNGHGQLRDIDEISHRVDTQQPNMRTRRPPSQTGSGQQLWIE